ncbi:MAG: PDZ domain-containing protein, partial [Bacteroidales bacterium]
VDDVITGIDGKKIHTFSDLQEALAKYRPGDKVKVTVVREKKTRELDVTLKNAQNMNQGSKEVNLESLGAEVAPVSDSVKRQLRINAGLEVTSVKEGKLQEAGIRRGFIILRANGETMNTVSDLENVLKTASQSPDQVLFVSGIYQSGRRANFAVDLSQD